MIVSRTAADLATVLEREHHPLLARTLLGRAIALGRIQFAGDFSDISDDELVDAIGTAGATSVAAAPDRGIEPPDAIAAVVDAPVTYALYGAAQALLAHHFGCFPVRRASILRNDRWPFWFLELEPIADPIIRALPTRLQLERAAMIAYAGPIADAAVTDVEDIAWSRPEYAADYDAARALLHLAVNEEPERDDDDGSELDLLELAIIARTRAILAAPRMHARLRAIARTLDLRNAVHGSTIADLYFDSSRPAHVRQRPTYHRHERSGFLVAVT